jgi:hypothetical protein
MFKLLTIIPLNTPELKFLGNEINNLNQSNAAYQNRISELEKELFNLKKK